jgi:hypothetical protein
MNNLKNFKQFINEAKSPNTTNIKELASKYGFKEMSTEHQEEYNTSLDVAYGKKSIIGMWILGSSKTDGIQLGYHIDECEIIGFWEDLNAVQYALDHIKQIENAVIELNLSGGDEYEDVEDANKQLNKLFKKYKGFAE